MKRVDWAHDFVGGMMIRRANLSLFNEAFLQQELNLGDNRTHEQEHVLTGPMMAYGFSWDRANFVTFGVSHLTLSSVDRQPAMPGATEQDWQRVTMSVIPVDLGYAYRGSIGKGAWVAGAALSLVRAAMEVEYDNPLEQSYNYDFRFSGFGLGAALHGEYQRSVWGILGITVGGRYDAAEKPKLGIDGQDWYWAAPGSRFERAAIDLSGPSLVFGVKIGA
jgi:hypothetical protein